MVPGKIIAYCQGKVLDKGEQIWYPMSGVKGKTLTRRQCYGRFGDDAPF